MQAIIMQNLKATAHIVKRVNHMVFNFPHNCTGLFQNSPHEKRRELQDQNYISE